MYLLTVLALCMKLRDTPHEHTILLISIGILCFVAFCILAFATIRDEYADPLHIKPLLPLWMYDGTYIFMFALVCVVIRHQDAVVRMPLMYYMVASFYGITTGSHIAVTEFEWRYKMECLRFQNRPFKEREQISLTVPLPKDLDEYNVSELQYRRTFLMEDICAYTKNSFYLQRHVFSTLKELPLQLSQSEAAEIESAD